MLKSHCQRDNKMPARSNPKNVTVHFFHSVKISETIIRFLLVEDEIAFFCYPLWNIVEQPTHSFHRSPHIVYVSAAISVQLPLPFFFGQPFLHILSGFSNADRIIRQLSYFPGQHFFKLLSDHKIQHILSIGYFFPPQSFCNVIKTPPKLIAYGSILLLWWSMD